MAIVVNWKHVGIGYLVLSIFCGILFAVIAAMLPAMVPGGQASQVEFWPSFWNALPMCLGIGFVLSPICYLLGQAAS